MYASIYQQYGRRLVASDKMPVREFYALVNGLMDNTPLGKMVSIRAENDNDILKSYNKDQKKIRDDWRRYVQNKISKNISKKEKEKIQADSLRSLHNYFSNLRK